MLDNQLIAAIVGIIRAGLTAAGTPYSTAVVLQSFQPTQEGVPSVPSVFLHKLSDHRYGFLGRQDIYDEAHEIFTHTETQVYESMFQITTLVTQDPANVNQMTASDLANRVAAILQSDATIATLLTSDIQILRVTDVRNPYFTDDRDRNEANPSFDFTLTHKQIIISSTPVIESVEINFDRV